MDGSIHRHYYGSSQATAQHIKYRTSSSPFPAAAAAAARRNTIADARIPSPSHTVYDYRQPARSQSNQTPPFRDKEPPPPLSSSSFGGSGETNFFDLKSYSLTRQGTTASPDNYGIMEAPRTNSVAAGSIASSIATSTTTSSQQDALNLLANPFELRHGRRYLRELPYPLPCDLAETQRQNMRTLLGVTIFGKPVCAPGVLKRIPKKVLEIGCGAAYWSSTCHDWFASHGHDDISFTGVDVAPLAPDLSRQGMNWRFVQHDLRRHPWPFEDGEFDLIMVKDMSLAIQIGISTQLFVDESIRILSEGGHVEFWESDHILRCLRPHPPPPPGMLKPEEEAAWSTKTYLISPGTPFAPAQNQYIANSNSWISEALDELQLAPTPCARILNIMYQEADTLSDVGFRRVAIPLGEFRWEKERLEGQKHSRSQSDGNPLNLSPIPSPGPSTGPPKGKGRAGEPTAAAAASTLTSDQAALRYTALLSVLQKIESLEPILKDVSGKNAEEWSRWWANMTSSLLDQENGSSGEVLEVGAWWATKRTQK